MDKATLEMKEHLNIVCFFWGDWLKRGPKADDRSNLGSVYIHNLYRSILRNLDRPFDFYVFLDEQNWELNLIRNIIKQPLETPTWYGKLPKITVFDPRHRWKGRVLVFDLDTVITGSLNEIAAYDGDFCVRAWYKGIPQGKWVPDGDTIGFRAGFGVKEIWEPFIDNVHEAELFTGGRERYWYRNQVRDPDLWQRLFPESFVSYKNHCLRHLPKNAKVVSFHGRPRPHEVNDTWVREHWNAK